MTKPRRNFLTPPHKPTGTEIAQSRRNAPAPDAAVVWPSSALKTAHRGACKQCQAFGLVTGAGFCVLCV